MLRGAITTQLAAERSLTVVFRVDSLDFWESNGDA